jgi:glucose/arabinose dehydrogenase
MRKRELASLAAALSMAAGVSVAALAPATAQPGSAVHVSNRNAPLETGIARTTLAEGLEHPWAVAFLPGGSMLVTERPGRLRLIENGALRAEPVPGVPTVFARGQGGLMDVVLHPRFAENRLVYFTYSAGTPDANHTRVARARYENGALSGWSDIFQVSDLKSGGQHFGARLAWMADGTLLVSVGDGGNPPTQLNGRLIRENAQSLDSHLGKVLRLKDDGSIPADNPHAARGGVAASIWSVGHRNIQGLAVDAGRGAVWASEHGALGGDELNRIERGANYGWPAVSLTRDYRGGAAVGQTSAAGMRDPALLWEVATAPSGLMVYGGSAFAAWRGDVFSGGLRSVDIRRLDLDEAGRVLGETAIGMGARVRDVREGPDGAIYVLTDERQGRLIRLAPES